MMRHARELALSAVAAGLVLVGPSGAPAGERPLEQLPSDVGRWSALWTLIPQTMHEVGQEYGPVAAVAWGPAQGTAVLMRSLTTELWDNAKQDDSPRAANRPPRAPGVMFTYTF